MKIYTPHSEQAEEFSKRLKKFFGGEYCKLPGSYEPFANLSNWDKDFDRYPVEKLQELYDRLRTEFPEPYLWLERDRRLDKILTD
jgi:hypothetical protein